jgi:hypothetical protein
MINADTFDIDKDGILIALASGFATRPPSAGVMTMLTQVPTSTPWTAKIRPHAHRAPRRWIDARGRRSCVNAAGGHQGVSPGRDLDLRLPDRRPHSHDGHRRQQGVVRRPWWTGTVKAASRC